MSDVWNKIKKTAQQTGRAMGKDQRLLNIADNLKEVAQAFTEGFKERAGLDKRCLKCDEIIPNTANFCPHCGHKLD